MAARNRQPTSQEVAAGHGAMTEAAVATTTPRTFSGILATRRRAS